MSTTATEREQDRAHLQRALALAERGRGRVSPNPMVGAVIARGDEVVGEGWHAELGGDHAEVSAIADASRRGAGPAGATMYVTLEPCAHHGRTPPCTDAILAAGLARVVVASEDPSGKASGRGPGILRDAGVEVDFAQGAEAADARLLNQPFRKHARTGLPHVVLKSAASLDGKVATRSGDSQWISGEASRALVHRWRAEADAVCVGIGTALADDPLLTARPEAGGEAPLGEGSAGSGAAEAGAPLIHQPTRVVFDSEARLPLDSKLVASVADAPLLVVTAPGAPAGRVEALHAAGAETIPVEGDEVARVRAALAELGRRGVTSLLLEGGPELAGAFHDAGEVDELRLFLAPILVGGREARPVAGGAGVERIEAAERALAMEWQASGEDLLVRARLREW